MQSPFFSEYEIIDWYDGAISGIGKTSTKEEFYLFDIVAFDLKTKDKVFLLLKINSDLYERYKMAIISNKPLIIKKLRKQLYSNYNDKLYLLKSKYIEDEVYNLKEVDAKTPSPYNNFETITNQSKELMDKWFNFFK